MARPYADLLEGPIRELRVSHGRKEVRVLFFIQGRDIVLTNGFLKKTDRIPRSEIERALRHREAWASATGGEREHGQKEG